MRVILEFDVPPRLLSDEKFPGLQVANIIDGARVFFIERPRANDLLDINGARIEFKGEHIGTVLVVDR